MPRLIACAAAMALLLVTGAAQAQVVSRTESPLRPFGKGATNTDKRHTTAPPTDETAYFATILPANPDGVSELAQARTIATASLFPAVRFVVSVAPALFADEADLGSGKESRIVGSLRHLNVLVTAEALDADGHVLPAGNAGAPAVSVLEMKPAEDAFNGDSTSNTQSEIGTAANVALGAMGPIGGILQEFRSSFRRQPGPTQVAYVTAANAFGWRWYESAENPIEGLHYTAALFQTPKNAASLRITMEVTGNWRTFGAWTKTYDFIYRIPPAN